MRAEARAESGKGRPHPVDALIGLDVGTSSVKAVLVGPDGQVLASRESRHPPANPRPGWLEQNPESWAEPVFAEAATLQQ